MLDVISIIIFFLMKNLFNLVPLVYFSLCCLFFYNLPKISLPRYLDISILHFTQFSHSVIPDSLWPTGLQHVRPLCPSTTSGLYPNSCPLSQSGHPTISSSIGSFSACPQSFPASGSFPMSQLFTSGGQSIGVSPSTSILPMKTQDWSPLRSTGWVSLQFKGLSRDFSSTTIQKNQFFGAQLSLESNSHIHTWLLEKL